MIKRFFKPLGFFAVTAMTVTSLGTLTAAVSSAAGVDYAKQPVSANTRGLSEEDRAIAEAKTVNRPVRVDGQTTPTQLVEANPDGTFSRTTSTQPVRMFTGGTWAEISTRLVTTDSGIRAERAPVDAVLGKGKSPLISTVSDKNGHSVAEKWPYGDLPEPKLDGSTATYPEVLPGTDLVQVMKLTGVSLVFKVKTPSAAKDPRLLQLKIALTAQNLDIVEDGAGGLQATSTKDGNVAFKSAAGQWWDSSYADSSASDPGGPGLSREFQLDLQHDASSLHEAVVPNEIANTAGLKYPLYVDPDWTPTRTSYVYVDSAFPSTSYWNGQYTPGTVNVGFLPAKWDTVYGMNHKARGYWQFDTGPSVSSTILAARMNVTNVWSSSCSPRTVKAWVTYGVGPGTTWNNQPGWLEGLDAKTFAMGNEGAGCADGTMSFDMMAGKNRLPTTSQWTVVLASEDENWDELSWKRFDSNATLTITYGKAPNKPEVTAMSSCSTNCPPTVTNTTTRGQTRTSKTNFTVYGSDPNGNADGSITAWLGVIRVSDNAQIWSMAAGQPAWLPGSGGSASWGYGSGTQGTDAPLADGDYVFSAVLVDQQGLVSPRTEYHFTVDRTPPPLPIIQPTTSALSPVPGQTGQWSDSSGTVGSTAYDFTIKNSSPELSKGFIYAITAIDVTPTYPAAMACGTRNGYFVMVCGTDLKTVPVRVAATDRQTRITAWSIDWAGNVGTEKERPAQVLFTVGKYAPMPGQTLAVTTSGTATALKIPAGTEGPTGSCTDLADDSVPDGFKGAALGLQGGYATTATAAADTANSFTVSGWFCPTTAQGTTSRPVIAQTDSAGTVLAELRINTAGKWELATRTTANATETVTAAGNPVSAGSWYFVNAVYDRINRQLRITYSTFNDTRTWTVATTSDTHAPAPAGSRVLLGASSTTPGTPRFTGLLAGPALTNAVLVNDQIKSLWAITNPTTVTVLK